MTTLGRLRRIISRNWRARLLWAALRGTGSTAVWVSLIRPGMTVVDLGANAGYYTFFASHAVGPKGRVHAFEPFPAAFAELRAEVARFKHRNVRLYNVAVSDQVGTHRMYVKPGHSPSNSLHPVPGLTLDDGPLVESIRLDDLGALHCSLHAMTVDVVKVDVEGHELHALRGMECMLKDSRPMLFLEFNPGTLRAAGTEPHELVSYLHGLGYGLYPIDERTGDMRRVLNTGELMAALPREAMVNLVARPA